MLSEIEQFIDRVRMRSPQAKTWRDYRSDRLARRGQPLSPLSGLYAVQVRPSTSLRELDLSKRREKTE